MEFKELDINQILLNNIEKMKFKTLTNVQEKVIPEILKGNDVLVKAQTGSGKTAAFLIPAINNILKSKIFGTKILILAPTRDLVNQIYDTCFELTKDLEINVIKVMGGTNIADQEKKIKNNPDIIIAVIGRLKYFLNKELVKLENLEYIILDEFDKMLDLGFRASIISLLEQIRNKTKSYKTLMFSATLPKSIETLSLKYLKNNFKKIEINEKKTINQLINQKFLIMDKSHMLKVLIKTIFDNNVQTIIFCNTINEATNLENLLKYIGLKCKALHSDRSQAFRQNIIEQFKQKQISILVSTDVLSRGIDIKDLPLVINFNLPDDQETYIHRIGRVGRAQSKGKAITITTLINEEKVKKMIERYQLHASIIKKNEWITPSKQNIKESIDLFFKKVK